jgi:hypothetical protein
VRLVRSLNIPAWGHNFVYRPFTRAERQLLANSGDVETVRAGWLPARLGDTLLPGSRPAPGEHQVGLSGIDADYLTIGADPLIFRA